MPTLAGSAPSHGTGGQWLEADPNLEVSATVVMRRPPDKSDLANELLAGRQPAMPREDMEKSLSAGAKDMQAVSDFMREHRLTVVTESAAARTVRVTGAIAQMDAAFGVNIRWRIDEQGRKSLSYTGEIVLPNVLHGVVEAVLGLDPRPAAKPAVV